METLATDFTLRAATIDDLPGIVAVMRSTVDVDSNAAAANADDVLSTWRRPSFDLSQDAWVVVTAEGLIVGYEEVGRIGEGGQAQIDGYVNPAYHNHGIGTTMLRTAEGRICAAMTMPKLHAQAGTVGRDTQAHAMFAAEGYALVRHFQRMEIALPAPATLAMLPNGSAIRSFVIGQDERATHATITEAFANHWGSVPTPFDEWLQITIHGNDQFDPSLWLLATEGEEVIAAALCRQRPEIGWINTLGVRRASRKRGIGIALLRHAFVTLHAHGSTRAGLGVDSSSLTGATRLYERAGMETTEQFAIFGKTLVR